MTMLLSSGSPGTIWNTTGSCYHSLQEHPPEIRSLLRNNLHFNQRKQVWVNISDPVPETSCLQISASLSSFKSLKSQFNFIAFNELKDERQNIFKNQKKFWLWWSGLEASIPIYLSLFFNEDQSLMIGKVSIVLQLNQSQRPTGLSLRDSVWQQETQHKSNSELQQSCVDTSPPHITNLNQLQLCLIVPESGPRPSARWRGRKKKKQRVSAVTPSAGGWWPTQGSTCGATLAGRRRRS